MMRRFTLLFVAALSVLSMSAAPVDMEQARKIALSFIKSNYPQTRSGQETLTLVWTDGVTGTRSGSSDAITSEPTFYVFDRTDVPGFVVVAGDDAVYPILGYGREQTFSKEGMPSNLRAWFDSYQRQINWLRSHNKQASVATREAWEKLGNGSLQLKSTGVELTTVLWDQMTPYNNLCPEVSGQRTPTGCVATSTAIAMQYHQWPDVGQGSHSYTTQTYKLSLSATFDTPYQWNNMPATYTAGQYTDQQAQNVATLMYDCGVFSDMDYAPGNSGALMLTAAQGLVNYMKYDKSLHVLQRENYQTAEWESIIKGELDNNRPVVYGGENDQKEGHQFIIDGYNTADYYHVNWGWSGLANGYYLLAVLEPEEQGTGGNSGGGFSLDQMAMISMQKPVEGSTYEDMLTFFYGESGGIVFDGLDASTDTFEPGQMFEVQFGYVGNMSIRNFTGDLVVALVDKDGNTKELISSEKSVSIDINNGIGGELACTITQPIASGDCIRLLYKSSDGNDWKWVRGGTDTYGEISVDGSDVANEEIAVPSLVTVSCNAGGTVSITSPVAIKEIALYDISGRLLKKQPAGGNTEVSLSCAGYPAGVYVMEVLTAEGKSSHKLFLSFAF
ncbi:thiol protease/hemagglutinin PrtT [Parabacteroides sp. AF17-28]|uniref:thiol protease/hemagglutinin PrtT n=1 Tax=Parabacteroides sp. AF17-28 TaxID=2292241 RepID=UPI001F16255F|nr:thiol protease/hemagglutinin PrtT [Parabacteroides sp. AF17-28]